MSNLLFVPAHYKEYMFKLGDRFYSSNKDYYCIIERIEIDYSIVTWYNTLTHKVYLTKYTLTNDWFISATQIIFKEKLNLPSWF